MRTNLVQWAVIVLLFSQHLIFGQGPTASSAGTENPRIATVPDGTPVFVRLCQTISTKGAHSGEALSFEVMEDVITRDGELAVAKGAPAYGYVTEAQAARMLGRRGRVSVEVESVQSVNGERITVRAERKAEGKGSNAERVMALAEDAPIAAYLLLKHGHDTEIPIGATFEVFVTGDQKVNVDRTRPLTGTRPLILYQRAFLRHDAGEMEKLAKARTDDSNIAESLLSAQSDTEAYYGHVERARDLTREAVEAALRNKSKERAALWEAIGALHEAELQNPKPAEEQALAALRLSSSKDIKCLAALALARAGQSKRAGGVASFWLAEKFPSDITLNGYWLPAVSAAIQLDHRKPSKALAVLKASQPYEMNAPYPLELAPVYPAYLRGEAFLSLRKAPEAAAEFEKITSHPGFVVNFPLGALAQLKLARAYALQNDDGKARTAYQRFLELWKTADPDLPSHKEALAEYAKYAQN